MRQNERAVRLPHVIALINASKSTEYEPLAHALLHDFEQALAAYAKLSRTDCPRFQYDDCADADTVITAISTVAASLPPIIKPGVRLYAIGITPEHDAARALPLLDNVRAQAFEAGIQWQGGLTVGSAETLKTHMHDPRMGFWRRNTSEAMDRFIGTVRLGGSVSEIQSALDSPYEREIAANAIIAPANLPSWLYRRLYIR